MLRRLVRVRMRRADRPALMRDCSPPRHRTDPPPHGPATARMDRQRFGRSVRALRQRLGWRQADLAARCGLSQPTISRVERGVVAGTPLGALEGIVVELGGELDVRVRWRGEELDRLLDAMHASIVERLVEILTPLGWECAVEVTFWIRREQGSVDVLAWHPPTG